MYQAPKLEKYGTFRNLTLAPGRAAGLGKLVIGDDLIPGIGMDCNPDPHSGAAACRS